MSVIALFKESGVYIFFKFLLLPNDVMFYCYLLTYMFSEKLSEAGQKKVLV